MSLGLVTVESDADRVGSARTLGHMGGICNDRGNCTLTQSQGARHAHRQVQQPLCIGSGAAFSNRRKGNALVECQRQVIGTDDQTIHTHQRSTRRSGLQGRELSCRISRVGNQCQCKVDVADVQTFLVGLPPIQTGKYINTVSANGEQIGAVNAGAIGQGDRAHRLGQGQITIDLEESKHIKRQVAAGLERFTLAAQHVESLSGARSCRDDEIGGTRGVIDHRGIAGGTVNGDLKTGSRSFKPVNTDK